MSDKIASHKFKYMPFVTEISISVHLNIVDIECCRFLKCGQKQKGKILFLMLADCN